MAEIKSCFQDFISMGLNVARKTSADGKNVDIILYDMQFLIVQKLDSLVEKKTQQLQQFAIKQD